MTEAASDSAGAEVSQFVQAWSDALAQVLSEISGSAVQCATESEAPAELAAAGEKDARMAAAFSGGLRGEMALRLDALSAVRAAQLFMSEAPTTETEPGPEHREAVAELLRQAAGLVATALKARWGEVTVRLESIAGAPSWPASSTWWLRAQAAEKTAICLESQLSAALAAALRAPKPENSVPAAPPPPPASPTASRDTADDGKLALLMDVELAVTLRFGGRNLLLREVLELSPGAVVELDRQVQDPVDVLLDGRLVARGEVVVVGGNYGLRVTEVLAAGAL